MALTVGPRQAHHLKGHRAATKQHLPSSLSCVSPRLGRQQLYQGVNLSFRNTFSKASMTTWILFVVIFTGQRCNGNDSGNSDRMQYLNKLLIIPVFRHATAAAGRSHFSAFTFHAGRRTMPSFLYVFRFGWQVPSMGLSPPHRMPVLDFHLLPPAPDAGSVSAWLRAVCF